MASSSASTNPGGSDGTPVSSPDIESSSKAPVAANRTPTHTGRTFYPAAALEHLNAIAPVAKTLLEKKTNGRPFRLFGDFDPVDFLDWAKLTQTIRLVLPKAPSKSLLKRLKVLCEPFPLVVSVVSYEDSESETTTRRDRAASASRGGGGGGGDNSGVVTTDGGIIRLKSIVSLKFPGFPTQNLQIKQATKVSWDKFRTIGPSIDDLLVVTEPGCYKVESVRVLFDPRSEDVFLDNPFPPAHIPATTTYQRGWKKSLAGNFGMNQAAPSAGVSGGKETSGMTTTDSTQTIHLRQQENTVPSPAWTFPIRGSEALEIFHLSNQRKPGGERVAPPAPEVEFMYHEAVPTNIIAQTCGVWVMSLEKFPAKPCPGYFRFIHIVDLDMPRSVAEDMVFTTSSALDLPDNPTHCTDGTCYDLDGPLLQFLINVHFY
ncbi:hypothetical protein Hypma_016245 [Hypsizygus marmoreus]|uniref:Uncharacterized protein n=1 Tax=Hypsizygus marmoreus TaxID=39966 RepID=A0A369J4Y2_HYPMA|nr:hypothetical protein Hypma_016245 [Hypsizygus marmoreus]